MVEDAFAVAAIRQRLLVVDDVPAVLKVLRRTLERRGYEVVTESDPWDAWERLGRDHFDLLITDLRMPDLDGIGLIEGVRKRNPGLPVIILTGTPSTDSAVRAVHLGAAAYLQKPVQAEQLFAAVERALDRRERAEALRSADDVSAASSEAQIHADRVGRERAFEQAVTGLFMAYQPIVKWSRKTVIAYEALARTSVAALAHPAALFEAAEALGKVDVLGQRIRAHCSETFLEARMRSTLFLNLHPSDLLDEGLSDPQGPLARLADNVVLEISERTKLDVLPNLEGRLETLRQMGFRLAIDDVGAGYAGLTSFVALQPDFVKLDMALVRGLHLDPTKHRVVAMLIDLCADLGIHVVAEGVETSEELDTLHSCGCDVFQGYLFARPGAPFPEANFGASWPRT